MDILLVEDNAGDAVLIRQILTESPVPVHLHIARDGEQALLMLKDALFRPSLIILDLNIPRISGLVLLERWRSINIPIVVFSSTANDKERARVLELGAREFVQKPNDIDNYIKVVSSIIHRYSGPGNSLAGGAGA